MTDRPAFVEHPLLAEAEGIRHGFFGRRGGVSREIYASLNCGLGSDDAPDNVCRNRALVAGALHEGDPYEAQAGDAHPTVLTAHQIHSDKVAVARSPWAAGDAPKADAIVTDRPNLIVAVLTADCAPVLFADADAGVVAAAHAGWRGACAGITDRTLEQMEELGARRARVAAVVGPTIGPASYEVGPELRDTIVAAETRDIGFFRPGAHGDRLMFDLPGYVVERLRRAGVARVAAVAADTYGLEGEYFSYRRGCHRGDPDYGRQISAIMRPKA